MSQAATLEKPAPVPAHVPADRVIAFDYLRDEALPHDPHARMEHLLDLPHSLVWTTANGGHWIATRRETVLKLLQQPELFSSAHINIPPMAYRAIRLVPEELDPPEHAKYRKLLNPVLSPAMVGDLAENARQVARELIDAVYADGEADIMKAVTVPMPCSIFMKLLGLPGERLADFLHYKDQFLFADDPAEKKAGIQSIATAIGDLAEARRAKPENDIMSVLVQAEVDGRLLNDEELLAMGFLLFLAGLDTVTSGMTNCLAYLAQNPGKRQELIDNPDLIRDAIEEILRRRSIVNMVRTAVCDLEFEGVPIKKGDQFLCSTILANLDERDTPDALTVDFERDPNPHLAFGGGPHRCVGSHLARIEIRVLLEEALPRLTNLRIKAGHHLHWHAANLVGLSELPVQWDVS